LGVWQSVPYLFADCWQLVRDRRAAARRASVDTRSLPYRVYLVAIATLPATSFVWTGFRQAQMWYAIVGAMFIPMLAVVLLVLNGRSRLVGRQHRNSLPVSILLAAILVFFLLAGWLEIQNRLL
jgi:hypothetical protein